MVEHVSRSSPSQQVSTVKKAALQHAFIDELGNHGNISKACELVGIDRGTVYNWKEKETRFLIRFNMAMERAKDRIREEIWRRGHDGWDEDVYQLGKHAGTVHKYSDTLLMFHAKAIMPEYRDKQQVEVSGTLTIKTEWGGGANTEESEVQHDRSIS